MVKRRTAPGRDQQIILTLKQKAQRKGTLQPAQGFINGFRL